MRVHFLREWQTKPTLEVMDEQTFVLVFSSFDDDGLLFV
jgi:hypothetical protein